MPMKRAVVDFVGHQLHTRLALLFSSVNDSGDAPKTVEKRMLTR